jgi:hypothetical protein
MQKLYATQNNKTGKAAADGLTGQCDRFGMQAGSIPPRSDGRYPDWVASDGLWPRLCKNSGFGMI